MARCHREPVECGRDRDRSGAGGDGDVTLSAGPAHVGCTVGPPVAVPITTFVPVGSTWLEPRLRRRTGCRRLRRTSRRPLRRRLRRRGRTARRYRPPERPIASANAAAAAPAPSPPAPPVQPRCGRAQVRTATASAAPADLVPAWRRMSSPPVKPPPRSGPRICTCGRRRQTAALACLAGCAAAVIAVSPNEREPAGGWALSHAGYR